jgi:hypothetical protein
MIKTLLEILLALLPPITLTFLAIGELTIIAHFESRVENGYGLDRVLRQHSQHLFAHFTIDLLNGAAPDLVELLRIQLVLRSLLLGHLLDYVGLNLENLHGTVQVPKLVILLVHLVFDTEEDIFVLILGLKLEVL